MSEHPAKIPTSVIVSPGSFDRSIEEELSASVFGDAAIRSVAAAALRRSSWWLASQGLIAHGDEWLSYEMDLRIDRPTRTEFPVRTTWYLERHVEEVRNALWQFAGTAALHQTSESFEAVRLVPANDGSSGGPPPESDARWGAAIGPVYTLSRAALELGWALHEADTAIQNGTLLAVTTSDHQVLLPIGQFDRSGAPVTGLRWIMNALRSIDLTDYTIAAWLNRKSDVLGGLSPWQELGRSGLSATLKSAVTDLATRFGASVSELA